MGKRDPRVDAYIAASADFARPILAHIRDVVHAACPQVEETMKWSFPHFMHHGMLCGMAAFKQHCTLGFWKGELVVGRASAADERAMGQFGRITSLAGLPPRAALATYMRKAAKLNEEGIKVARAKPRARPEAAIPDDLSAAFKRNRKAGAAFAAFSPSQRREYVEWIVEAKREETRAKRLAQAIEWVAEGKARNWKYEKC